MKIFIFFVLCCILFSCNQPQKIKFAVCTDVHQDLIHDAPERLEQFVKSAKAYNAEYIIQLGDFCFPKSENEEFMKAWNSFEGAFYHVLGNHDMDICNKQTIQDFWGMEKPFYSFDEGDFHFIVLDLNFYKEGDEYVPYANGNYYAHSKSRCYVSPEQLDWLKADLASTDKLTVVFSHQSLENKDGAQNKEEVWKIFAEANQASKKVIACFSGHDHSDTHREIDGVHYIGLNSTSYAWVGSKMEYSGRYSEEIEKKRPNLKYILPYEKPVYALVEIDPNGTILIKGVKSGFVKPGPEELGVEDHDYTANISSRKLEF